MLSKNNKQLNLMEVVVYSNLNSTTTNKEKIKAQKTSKIDLNSISACHQAQKPSISPRKPWFNST